MAHDDETGIRTLRKNVVKRFNQDELTLIWTNHTDIANEWRVCAETHFAPEFHSIAWRSKFLKINGRADDLDLCRVDSVFLHELPFDYRCVGNDFRTAMLENESASFASDWICDTARAD